MKNKSENLPEYLKKPYLSSWHDIENQFANYRADLNYVRPETRTEKRGIKSVSKKWTSSAPTQYDPDIEYNVQHGGIIPFSSDEDYANLEQHIAQAKSLALKIEPLIKSHSHSFKLLSLWGYFANLMGRIESSWLRENEPLQHERGGMSTKQNTQLDAHKVWYSIKYMQLREKGSKRAIIDGKIKALLDEILESEIPEKEKFNKDWYRRFFNDEDELTNAFRDRKLTINEMEKLSKNPNNLNIPK